MLLKEKFTHLFLLKKQKKSIKNNIDHCLDYNLYHAIYRCIAIHHRQYIDTSTHCIVATLVAIDVQHGNAASVMATIPSSQDWTEFVSLPTV